MLPSEQHVADESAVDPGLKNFHPAARRGDLAVAHLQSAAADLHRVAIGAASAWA